MKRKMATVFTLRESLSLSCSLHANGLSRGGRCGGHPLTTMQTLVLLSVIVVYFDLTNPEQCYSFILFVWIWCDSFQIFIIRAVKSNLHYICGKIKSPLYLRYYAEACNWRQDPSPRFSAWATQLRRHNTAMPKRWRLKDRSQTSSTDSDVFHHSIDRSILPWFVNEMLWTAPCSWALHFFCEVVAKFQRQWRSLPSQPIR